jgi:hypothetical protein
VAEQAAVNRRVGGSKPSSGAIWSSFNHKDPLVEMTMTTIQHEVEANCPPQRVWAILADLEAVQRYNPTVRAGLPSRSRGRDGLNARIVVWEGGHPLWCGETDVQAVLSTLIGK